MQKTKLFKIYYENNHKIIYLLGIKIKVKNHILIVEQQLNYLSQKIDKCETNINEIKKIYKTKSVEITEISQMLTASKEKIQDINNTIQKINKRAENIDNTIQVINKRTDGELKPLQSIPKLVRECIYSNVLSNCTKNTEWLKQSNFTLTGGAANYSFIFILFKILDTLRINNILEFGLGQSSKVTTQYAKYKNPDSTLSIVEHNQEWIDYFKKELILSEKTQIYQKNLINFDLNGVESEKYEPLDNIIGNKKFDLIIIDGPIGQDKTYPRTNILDIIPEHLAESFVIILDDAERTGEKNTANLILKKLDDNNINYCKSYKVGAKTQLLITSKDYEFINWY